MVTAVFRGYNIELCVAYYQAKCNAVQMSILRFLGISLHHYSTNALRCMTLIECTVHWDSNGGDT